MANVPGRGPDLELGFPAIGGQYIDSSRKGPARYTLVGNIDDEPTLEIIAMSGSSGPYGGPRSLYAWKSNGTISPNWPLSVNDGSLSLPALGNLSAKSTGLEVFSAWFTSSKTNSPSSQYGGLAYEGLGFPLLGWPQGLGPLEYAPVLGDIDGDGIDEIFAGTLNGELHAYRANGTTLPGWPRLSGRNQRQIPALADLDGDGALEIIATGKSTEVNILLNAYHQDGTTVAGFPVYAPQQHLPFAAPPVIGDIDGDGSPDVVAATLKTSGDAFVHIVSNTGTTKHIIKMDGRFAARSNLVPVLADLTCDGVPEIIVQAADGVYVWKGDGTPLIGWPQQTLDPLPGPSELLGPGPGNSAPVVGDVDGNGLPDIIITLQTNPVRSEVSKYRYSNDPNKQIVDGEVRAYSHEGKLLPGFPKALPLGFSAIPAIADIDLDGRNEIIVTSTLDTYGQVTPPTMGDRVWVFDLHGPSSYGPVLWGQLGGGPQHQGYYKPGTSCAK